MLIINSQILNQTQLFVSLFNSKLCFNLSKTYAGVSLFMDILNPMLLLLPVILVYSINKTTLTIVRTTV